MTLPRSLSILPVLFGIGVATAATAGADSPTEPYSPATTVPDVPAECHDLGAFTSLTVEANGRTGPTLDSVGPLRVGDAVTATWTTKSGCEAQWHWISPYATASLTFDPSETQERMVGSVGMPLGSGGSMTFVVPPGLWPLCRIQIDHHTGPLVPVIDETHRLNAPAFGLPGYDELIGLGVYVEDENCEEPQPETPQQPEQPPVVDEPLQPASPSTTAPAAPPESTTIVTRVTEVTQVAAPETLPFTGDHTGPLAAIGASIVALGLALVTRARRLTS